MRKPTQRQYKRAFTANKEAVKKKRVIQNMPVEVSWIILIFGHLVYQAYLTAWVGCTARTDDCSLFGSWESGNLSGKRV